MKYPRLALHHAVCRGLGLQIKTTPQLGNRKGEAIHATHGKRPVAELPSMNRVKMPAKLSLTPQPFFVNTWELAPVTPDRKPLPIR